MNLLRWTRGHKKLAGLVASLVTLGFAGSLTAAEAPECSQIARDAISESSEFTPFEARLSFLPEVPINPSGKASLDAGDAAVPANALDNLSLQLVVGDESTLVGQYFLDRSIEPQMTTSSFLDAGGIQFARGLMPNQDSFASYLIATAGKRAVPIQIGKYQAALVWADPDINGVRSHNLYWADGAYEYQLIAVRPPEDLVNLGRSLVC